MLKAIPLPIGNAIKLIGSLAAVNAKGWRILRKTSPTFLNEVDPDASLIAEGSGRHVYAMDAEGLTNGTTYHYRLFVLDILWSAEDAVSAVPSWAVGDVIVDVQDFVTDRLAEGLKGAVAAGKVYHKDGAIPVQTAPPLFDETTFPVVTIHCTQDASGERAIGENMLGEQFDALADEWDISEGWLSRWDIQIIGWALNPDARIALRKVLKAIVIGNLPVFDAAGMVQVDFSQGDAEDFESFAAPVYQTMGRLTCMAPSAVVATDDPIREVDLIVNGEPNGEEQ